MSFGTTYFAPAPMGREMDFGATVPRQSFHQRSCSGNAYSEEMFMVSKVGTDPRNLYVDEQRDLSPADSSAFLHVDRASPGAKPQRDRMRLNRILNGGAEHQQQSTQSASPTADHYNGYPVQATSPSLQSFHSTTASLPVSTFPVSPCSPMAAPVPSLSPMTPSDGSPVPAGMAPTLATMSSPMSPLTSLSTVSQGLILEDVMPYSYNLPHYQPQAYPFKHAGNARIPEQPTFITDSVQGASSPSHAYHSHSPDPSGSPPVFSTFPPRMNSLVDHSYALADSTSPAFYQGQSHLSSPYGVVPHSPISNGSYTPSYSHSDSLGSGFTAASPVTPHYGFSHIPDARYGPMPVYGDLSLQAQTTAQTGKPSKFRSRKSPYDRRTNDQGLSGAAPPPRRFQCPECEKAFPTKGELASHSRCHLKVPAFMCGICGRPFKRRTDYVRHVRNVHEEVGRYGCAQCGERFGRLDKLKRHDKRGCGADKEESQ